MKITSFNPLILSRHQEDIVGLFEAMGFEKRHVKAEIEGKEHTNIRMKDANGFYVDVASTNSVPQDMTSIRINVDDFDEALDFFLSRGFINVREDDSIEIGSSRDTYLISPSGFAVTLIQHIRKS